MKVESYQNRFVKDSQYGELINYYHLARSAGCHTKYDRMIKACQWFNEKHPEVSRTAAYKDLSANLEGY
jgi:hypothetical protein